VNYRRENGECNYGCGCGFDQWHRHGGSSPMRAALKCIVAHHRLPIREDAVRDRASWCDCPTAQRRAPAPASNGSALAEMGTGRVSKICPVRGDLWLTKPQ
jgi:hypothetical protein